jgi:SAM-dependent methyltransferase/uncharacterized protein YbaR (Trm112 family)
MRQELLDLIDCPACGGCSFALRIDQHDGCEIREGEVTCQECQRGYPVHEGILDLLIHPSTEIVKEQDGWTVLEKAVVNTDEVMLALPEAVGEHKPAWAYQANNFRYMWSQLQLNGSERVLDLGAGRCWSTRFFAREGCYCVGIDILLTKYVGLRTADIFLNHDHIYFERICGDMNRLPFRDDKFDIVFVTATMHHTSNLAVATKEISRVLKPGGQAMIINEPVIGPFKSKKLDCAEVQHGINEHVYHLWEYLRELRREGMTFRLYPYIGSYHRLVGVPNHWLVKMFPAQLMQQRIWTPLLYTQLLVFGGGLNLIAHKPRR